MEIINFIYETFISQETLLSTWVLFLVGYVWTVKTDNVDDAAAAHVNDLQDEKLDRDGQIPCTGTSQWDKGADIASAATLAPQNDGNYFDVTGTTTITAINAVRSQPGTVIKLHFDGILKIVHDGNNIVLPDGKDIYTLAGTELEFVEYEANKWRATGYLRGTPVLTNLLSNEKFGFWSQSDDNKGIAELVFKNGTTAPVVGEAINGVSGRGKVQYLTISGGTWGGNDAAGSVFLGAVTGAYEDNETIAGSIAASFDVDGDLNIGVKNDPMNDDSVAAVWTDDGANITLTHVGALYTVVTALGNQRAWIANAPFEKGHIYKIEADIKDGTVASRNVQGYFDDGAAQYGQSKTTAAGWASVSWTFECATTTATGKVGFKVVENMGGGGNNFEIRRFSCYEITPCCTAANIVAFDGCTKDSTLDIYRQHNDGGTLTQDGSFYSLKMVATAGGDYIRIVNATISSSAEWCQQFAGRTVTFGAWVKTSTASHAYLRLYDGAYVNSPYHSGGGGWEWIEVTDVISATVTIFFPNIIGAQAPNVNGTTIIYISQPMLVFGSSIGEGNYQPKQQEWIWAEKNIPSNTYDGLLNQSDLAFTDFNVESEFDAMVPKGAKMIAILTDIEDSGSGGALDVHLELRKDATAGVFFCNNVTGKPNDILSHLSGLQPCDVNGDVDIKIEASGANTLDINTFECHGVQVN